MAKVNLSDRKTGLLLLCVFSFMQLQCASESDFITSTDLTPGEVITDDNDWLEFRVGDMPLVISAPHGGTINPDHIRDRTCSGATTVRDRNTTELAFDVQQALKNKYQKQPFVIAAHIARKKIDLNRDMDEATCSNENMEDTWHQYHEYIEQAIAKAVNDFGRVIYIDLHGHGHEKQRLELGYLLSKSDLRNNYTDPNGTSGLNEKSSLRNLLNQQNEVDLKELLTGEFSFGALMEEGEIASVPSLEDPYPLSDDAYFTGGYNTRRYTSTDYPDVFGFQIEANYSGVRDAEGRPRFASAFADAITTYMNTYLN